MRSATPDNLKSPYQRMVDFETRNAEFGYDLFDAAIDYAVEHDEPRAVAYAGYLGALARRKLAYEMAVDEEWMIEIDDIGEDAEVYTELEA